jgi:NitT/TauT family transport system ATP-binding protein
VSFDTDAGPVAVVDGVSFDIFPGETLALVGESGSGKSVTAMSIVRLIEAQRGRVHAGNIRFEGTDVTAASEHELRALRGRRIGMVFQEYALLPWKTTQANIEFGLRLKRVPREERARIARRFIDMVGLTGFENKYPHQLSGGMRQRAAVARVLANNPTVLLMDEPFAAVDAMTRQRLQEELAIIATTERTTVLFVTHAIDEAVFLSDRVVALSGRPGRIVADIDIDLPRPRRWSDLVRDERFQHYRDTLTASIERPAAASEAQP